MRLGPESSSSRRLISLRVVGLPQPEEPRSTTVSLALMEKGTQPPQAFPIPGKTFVTSVSSIISSSGSREKRRGARKGLWVGERSSAQAHHSPPGAHAKDRFFVAGRRAICGQPHSTAFNPVTWCRNMERPPGKSCAPVRREVHYDSLPTLNRGGKDVERAGGQPAGVDKGEISQAFTKRPPWQWHSISL